ncbi:hypothetical protein FN846DRAFT_893352 [Sphaerosporella brunnea]|uniref:Uncharacterized protein n=1 Tax=Sphaerosporella brunnea TaxID=1250544 RepID=A0A5J5EMC2_9PEZI|nr:hypothetical protein FN846DRAFT_893352 [Sphaerosporella brunnea]
MTVQPQIPALVQPQMSALIQHLQDTHLGWLPDDHLPTTVVLHQDTGEIDEIPTRVHITRFKNDTMDMLTKCLVDMHIHNFHFPGVMNVVCVNAVYWLNDGAEVSFGRGRVHHKYADRVVQLRMNLTRFP